MSTLRIYLTAETLSAIDKWRRSDHICMEPIELGCEVITDGKPVTLTPERVILVDVEKSTQKRVEVKPNNAEVTSWQSH